MKAINMNLNCATRRSARHNLTAVELAIVLAVIAFGGGLLAYEWCRADSAKTHYIPTLRQSEIRSGATH
jgi:hypothetical protein